MMELLRQEAAHATGSRDIRNVIYTGDDGIILYRKEDAQTETESEWMLFLVQFEDKQDEDWYFMFQRRPHRDWSFGDGDCGPGRRISAHSKGTASRHPALISKGRMGILSAER